MYEEKDMSKRIGYTIKQIDLLNQARLNQVFAKFDLTASQTFTMIYLFKAHEAGRQVNQKDIEKGMDITNPTVTGILNRLESKGLIKRVVCKEDARAKNICISEKALKLDVVLKKSFEENEQQLVDCLDEKEQAELQYLLEKVLRNM